MLRMRTVGPGHTLNSRTSANAMTYLSEEHNGTQSVSVTRAT